MLMLLLPQLLPPSASSWCLERLAKEEL